MTYLTNKTKREAILSGLLLIFGMVSCAVVEDDGQYGDARDDSSTTVAGYSYDGDFSHVHEIDSTPPTEPSVMRTIDNCVAPDRSEYMARFDVTAEDKDLTDPNVRKAKTHTVLYIFDKSGSMASSWNDSSASKWNVAREAMISGTEPYVQYV